MTKSALRKQIHEYVDQVDEHLLTIVHQLLEREIYSDDIELSEADLRLIEKRKAEMRSGKVKGVSHKNMITQLRNDARASK